jgi:hypothetical protein
VPTRGPTRRASLDPEKAVTILTLMHDFSRAGGMAVLCSRASRSSPRASPTGVLC